MSMYKNFGDIGVWSCSIFFFSFLFTLDSFRTFFLTTRMNILILNVDYDSSNDSLSDIEFHFVESCLNILFSVLLLIIPHAEKRKYFEFRA